jgi:hypothetical protein
MPTAPSSTRKYSPYPRLPAVDYEGARAATSLFTFDPRAGYGTLEISFFIKDCLVLGLTEGDCRGFSKSAGPTNSRAFVSLDFETGSGYLRVNPSCMDGPLGRGCSDAFEIGGAFLGSPSLRHKNRFLVDETSNGLDLSFGLVNSAAVGLLGPAVPGITGSLEIILKPNGKITIVPSGDPYPSIEANQRLPDGSIRTVFQQSERQLPGSSGPICLMPGVNRLC